MIFGDLVKKYNIQEQISKPLSTIKLNGSYTKLKKDTRLIDTFNPGGYVKMLMDVYVWSGSDCELVFVPDNNHLTLIETYKLSEADVIYKQGYDKEGKLIILG